VLLDGGDRALHPRIAGRQEADQGDHQQARVEELRAIGLHEGAETRIKALPAHVGMDPGT
jgi:hypothetical protein